MSTNVPPIQWTATGLVVPTPAEILAGVQQDINAAFGGNLNPALSTPQGQLATSLAAAIANCYAQFTNLVNGVNPDLNSGFMQDAIGRIYFTNRKPGTPTIVQCTIIGLVGATIPAGALAQDTSENLYTCVDGGVIPSGGTVTLPFQNVVDGPIACAAHTLTRIYQAVPGWDSIDNPADGVPGTNVESTSSYEYRREQSVAANAHGSADAIYGAVIDIPDVTDAYVFENTTSSPIFVGSTLFELVPHSVYVGVIGGDPQAIANAIWTKKDLGCDMNGNVTETVVDQNYSYPQPSYSIKFEDCTTNPAVYNFTVNIVDSVALPSTIVTDVTNAITAQFLGELPGSRRVRIGSFLLAANFYGPVANCEGPSVPVQVLSIFIGSDFAGHGTLVNSSRVLTITGVTSGSLTPGTVVAGTQIPAATQIVQQLTGAAGGIGTYQMSAEATGTVSSPEVITGSATATAQLVGIDQAPELGTVTVNLI